MLMFELFNIKTISISIMCGNFNKFWNFLEELLAKVNNKKIKKITL